MPVKEIRRKKRRDLQIGKGWKNITIGQVAEILNKCAVSSSVIWREWRLLLDIDLTESETKQIESLPPLGIFTMLITKWVGKQGRFATVAPFEDLLRGHGHVAHADALADGITSEEYSYNMSCDEETSTTPLQAQPKIYVPEVPQSKLRTIYQQFKKARKPLIILTIVIVSLLFVSALAVICLPGIPKNSPDPNIIASNMGDTTNKISDDGKECYLECKNITSCDNLDTAKNIYWKGDISSYSILLLITKSKQLSHLEITHSQCSSVHVDQALSNGRLNDLQLNRLKHLALKNFSYALSSLRLVLDVPFTGLTVLSIEDTELGFDESLKVAESIKRNRGKLVSLSMPVSTFNERINPDNETLYPVLQKLIINFPRKSEELELKSDLSFHFPELKVFNSTTGSIELRDIQKLLRCKKLETLTANVRVPKHVTSIQVMDHFRSRPKSLQYVELMFLFESRSCKAINNTEKFIYINIQSNCAPDK